MTVRTALDQGIRLLEDGHVPAPRLTAEVLLSHALQREKIYLYTHPEHELPELAWIHFGRYLHERLNGKPTQYITKHQEFYGRDFIVSPAVLIPRPETEHVVETALAYVRPGSRVIDVGCGSGAIAVSISLEAGLEILATDVSVDALAVARENADRLGAKVTFAAADLLAAVRNRMVDIVVSNPPYVGIEDKPNLQREVRDYEPEVALYGGQTGNEIYQQLIAESERVLVPGGRIVFELGYRSLDAVRSMLGERWTGIKSVTDLVGYPRVLTARLAE